MAAVCVRHSDVSGVWASLACKCLFASVGGALALAVVLVWDGACEGEGRARRAGVHALTVIENVTVTHCLARSLVRRSACVGTVRVAPYSLIQVLALIFSTRRLLETPRCVPTLPLHA